MSYSLSPSTIRHAYHAARRAHTSLSAHRGRVEGAVGQIAQTVEVGAAAFGFGYLNGKGIKLPGANLPPIDLTAGVLLQAAAHFGLAGKYGEHLHNFADGALAAYAAKLGTRAGAGQPLTFMSGVAQPGFFAGVSQRSRPRNGNMPYSMNAGCDNSPLSEAELLNMAHATR